MLANYLFGGIILGLFSSSVSEILARVIVLFAAISVHEFAHGYVAYKLGDPTAKYAGRLTLNPMSHLDPIGAVCMALFGFGWAKPVPVNPVYFKDRKRDTALVALAGPLSNILMAFLSLFLVTFYSKLGNVNIVNGNIFYGFESNIVEFGFVTLCQFAFLNVGFAVFNLIPFPPLDGSKILGAFLSQRSYAKLLLYETIGFPILMLLSFTGVLGMVLNVIRTPILNLWTACLGQLINLM